MFKHIAQYGPTAEQIKAAEQELGRVDTYTDMPTTNLSAILYKAKMLVHALNHAQKLLDMEPTTEQEPQQAEQAEGVQENTKTASA